MGKQGPLSSSELVEISAELPDVVLEESAHWTNITFKGRGFAWVDHQENRAMIKAHHDEAPPCWRPPPRSASSSRKPGG